MLTSSHSHHLSKVRHRLTLTGMLVIGAIGLSACGGPPDPTTAAEEFAQGLGSDELQALQDLPLTDGSAEPSSVAEAITALAQYPVSIEVDAATVHDDDDHMATADYTVTWQLAPAEDTENEAEPAETAATSDETWSYTTQAQLLWDEESEQWRPELAHDTLVPGLADGGHVAVARDSADRGEILDTHEEPLTTERSVRRIGIDKMHLHESLSSDGSEPSDEDMTEALTASATDLAEALDLDAEPFVDRVLAAGERAWVEFIVLRAEGDTPIPFEQINDIPGAAAQEDTMVLGPTATFARSILGSYGLPTAEQIENSDGAMVAGVHTGLSGLQQMYNAELAGLDGLQIAVDNAEVSSEQLPSSEPVEFAREATDGTSITTTMDATIQELAEETVGDSEVLAGLVAIRPSDGHILAAAEGPAETSWPVALTGSYAPGSTFKMVTALAMLRNGMTPESTVSCPETITIEGTEISNFDEYPSAYVGDISLADAIAQSCNTVFVGQWEDISPDAFHQAAVDLGLVEEPNTGFNGTFLGSVPTDTAGAEHAAGLFGQGVVEASPLGMATVAASVAAGHTVAPVLVQDPEVRSDNAAAEDSALTAQEAEMLRELMAGPVETGTVPVLQQVPGEPVLAKTGTAQFVEDGETLAHTWIMATHGDLAVSLFFHEGVAGAQTNGPVLQTFLTELDEL